jgi:peptide deformylase
MAQLEILEYPDKNLKKKSKAVRSVDRSLRALIKNMAETMYAAPGIGLAAPQVGKLVRLVIADVGEGLVAIVNPKITARSGDQTYMEGCLSVPGLEAPVKRAEKITVKGIDKTGKALELEAEGLLSTVLQHEIDHLDGKLFIDRVSDPSLIRPITKPEAAERDKVCLEGKIEECMM